MRPYRYPDAIQECVIGKLTSREIIDRAPNR
jgi:hypothetical protein